MVSFKKGFTIAEMLTCVLIMAILVTLSIKVFTRRHQKPVYNPVHGYFVCYRDASGRVYQKSGSQDPSLTNGSCSFRPVKFANYYVMYAIGGGGGGGSSYGGSQGAFSSVFLTSIADSLTIYPGKGGAYNEDGGDTYVKNPEGDVVLSNAGGLAGRGQSIDASNVESCEAYPLPRVLNQVHFKNDTSDLPSCTVTKTGLTASVCTEKITDINQDSYINNFFRGVENARSYVSNYPSSTAYDGYYPYDSETNRLYYYPYNPYRSNSDMYYDGDTHTVYGYSTYYSSWYYLGAGINTDSLCVTETLDYSRISLNSNDSGRYITRASSSSNPLFKIIMRLNKNLEVTNLSSGVSSSEFVEYVKNSGLMGNINLLNNAGRGGSVYNAGYPGAVMISW